MKLIEKTKEMNKGNRYFDNRPLKIYGSLFILTFFLTGLFIRSNQTAESYTSQAVVSYSPEVTVKTTKDTIAWSKGTILPEDQAGYFYATEPLATIVPKLKLHHASGKEVKGELISSISLEVTSDTNQNYWTYPLVEERRSQIVFQQDKAKEWVYEGYADTVEMADVHKVIQEVNNELGFSGGEYELVYTVEIDLEGRADGQIIDKNEIYRMSVPMLDTYFLVPPVSEASYSLPLFRLPPTDRTTPATAWTWVENHWLLIVLTIVFFGLYVNEWLRLNRPVEKNVKEYKKFKEWITEGSVSLDNRTIINVYSLEGLVDLAIDLEKRVLHDPQKNKYTVFEDSFAYVYYPEANHHKISKKLTSLRDLLFEMELIDHEELELALNYRQAYGGRLGETLVSLGFLNETSLYSALAKQVGMNLFSIVPNELPIQVEWLGNMTMKDCIRYEVVPVGKKGNILIVASGTAEIVESREFLEEKFDSKIEFVLSESDQIRQAIDRYDMELIRLTSDPNQKRIHRSREERLNHFREQYEKTNFDLRDFLGLTGIIPSENMLVLPDKQTIIRYLIRRNHMEPEMGHLLRAINTSIAGLTKKEAYALQQPSIITILKDGGYISQEAVDEIKATCGEDVALQKAFMLEQFIISPHTMKVLEDLYRELAAVIQEIKNKS